MHLIASHFLRYVSIHPWFSDDFLIRARLCALRVWICCMFPSAFGENLPIPEIIAIGGQSDGKSSLLEAFLGFRFNIREVEMGTRRPLMLQMVHDPTAQEPRVMLQAEDSDEYGPPIKPDSGEGPLCCITVAL
eukprot:7086427-Pyramimonas_sp.AAC.2